MEDEKEEFRKKLEKLKPKKKKMVVPMDLLEQANSYEDKLGAVKILVDRERNRTVLLIKSLLDESNNPKK